MPWRVGRNDKECFWAVNEPDDGPSAPSDPSTSGAPFPGQLLHPYVYITKAIEWLLADPKHIDEPDIPLEERVALLRGRVRMDWTIGRVGAMATQEILDGLRAIGTTLDADGFRGLAAQYMSAIDLAEAHFGRPEDIPAPYDDDFTWMAALELWRRLLPERPCVEMVEEELVDGYLAFEDDDVAGIVAHWEAAWSLLKKAAPVQVKSLDMAEVALTGHPPMQLPDWCDNFESVLDDMALEDRPSAPRRLAFCTDFLERFPESDNERLLSIRKAVGETHAILGDRRRADAAFKAMVRDYPDDPSVLVAWADSFWMVQIPGPDAIPAKDLARAERMYVKALGMRGADHDDVWEKLDDLREEQKELSA